MSAQGNYALLITHAGYNKIEQAVKFQPGKMQVGDARGSVKNPPFGLNGVYYLRRGNLISIS